MGAERWCNQVGARAVALLYLSPEQGNFYHSVFTILQKDAVNAEERGLARTQCSKNT